jgi:hypothetical protein
LIRVADLVTRVRTALGIALRPAGAIGIVIGEASRAHSDLVG